MEIIKDKTELRNIKPKEIFSRLMQLHAEQMFSTDGLPKEILENSPLRQHLVFSANIKRLTEAEIRSANLYLSETLTIIKKKYLAKKISPPYEATQSAAWAYEILTPRIPKRRYQEALMLWLWGSPAMEGRRIHPPKETEDREISIALADYVACSMEHCLTDVPKILEQAITEAKACGDEITLVKASTLLSHVQQSFANYEREQQRKRLDDKFLERLATRLRKGSYGKVTVRKGYIELNINDPNFTFNPKVLQPEPNGGKFGKRSSLLAIHTKMEADGLGLNSEKMELRPSITYISDTCVKLDFVFTDKK